MEEEEEEEAEEAGATATTEATGGVGGERENCKLYNEMERTVPKESDEAERGRGRRDRERSRRRKEKLPFKGLTSALPLLSHLRVLECALFDSPIRSCAR